MPFIKVFLNSWDDGLRFLGDQSGVGLYVSLKVESQSPSRYVPQLSRSHSLRVAIAAAGEGCQENNYTEQ
jgi:hypothetical protein